MKIVFLDFDGVLNTFEGVQAKGHAYYNDPCDPVHVQHLNTILERSGARVVISSSWRVGRKLVELREMLGNAGFKGLVIDKTESLGKRGIEIQAWLDSYKREPVEAFVILDDQADMCHLEKRCVRTDVHGGLLAEHVDKALEKLGVQPAGSAP